MKKVCVFGDSITKGVVLDNGKYVYLKDSFVSLVSRAQRFAIENFSRFGCTVGRCASLLAKCEKEIGESDITVFEFGGNDCDFNWAQVAENPEAPHVSNTPVELFTEGYGDLIEKVRTLNSVPVVLNLPPIDADRYFSHISVGLNAENIKKFLGDVQHIARWQEMYNIAVMKLAKQHNVEVIDIRSAFLEQADFTSYICDDGIHPNARGHALMYSTVGAFINERMGKLTA